MALSFFDNLPVDVQISLIRTVGWECLARMRNPPREVVVAALELSPLAIQYVSNPTEYDMHMAVLRDPYVLQHIKCDIPQYIIMSALRTDPYAIWVLNRENFEAWEYAALKIDAYHPSHREQQTEIIRRIQYALAFNPDVEYYFKNAVCCVRFLRAEDELQFDLWK